MYELIYVKCNLEGVRNTLTGECIPIDNANPQWCAFLTWNDAQETPLALMSHRAAVTVPTWEEIRGRRNALIAASDWVVIRAAEKQEPIPAAWATYRQALRDIPQSCATPGDVVWPEKP
jgi:hypothetical protein